MKTKSLVEIQSHLGKSVFVKELKLLFRDEKVKRKLELDVNGDQ